MTTDTISKGKLKRLNEESDLERLSRKDIVDVIGRGKMLVQYIDPNEISLMGISKSSVICIEITRDSLSVNNGSLSLNGDFKASKTFNYKTEKKEYERLSVYLERNGLTIKE